MRRRRAILERLGLALAGLLVPLALLEAGMRFAGAGGPVAFDSTFDRSEAFYFPHPSRANPWSRDGEEVLKVAVIGDSCTVGQANFFDDTYPLRLERLLNLNAGVPPAEVRVWARRGTSTYQHAAWLPEVVEYGPDLVVLGIYLNDPEDFSDGELWRWRRRLKTRVPRGWKLSLLRRSRALGWIYQRIEGIRLQRAGIAYHRWLFDPAGRGWRRFERALDRFAAVGRSEDFRFAVVVFPFMGALGPDYPLRFAHEQIGELVRGLEVPHLDLLEELEDKSALRMSAFPGVDDHPSEIAHRIAAHEIFHFLLDEELIDPAYAPDHMSRRKRRSQWRLRLHRARGYLHPAPPAEPADRRRRGPDRADSEADPGG